MNNRAATTNVTKRKVIKTIKDTGSDCDIKNNSTKMNMIMNKYATNTIVVKKKVLKTIKDIDSEDNDNNTSKMNAIIKNILCKHKIKFQNTFEINNIYHYGDHNYIELKDTYCDIKKCHHDENKTYIELYPYKFDIKCHNKSCRGKSIRHYINMCTNDIKNVLINETTVNFNKILLHDNKQSDNSQSVEKILHHISNKEYTDVYLQFINECTEDSAHHVKSIDLYEHFKNWFNNNNPGTKIPSNRRFGANIKRFDKIIETIKFDGKTTSGVKYLCIKDSNKLQSLEKNLNNNMNKCKGIDNICPYENKSYKKYDGYCVECFSNIHVDDTRIQKMSDKVKQKVSKENIVKNYIINNHDGMWYHNIPIYYNFDGGCCPTRRRIDLRQLIGNTMLCIEIDENQHKWYPKWDDFVRYNEFLCDFTGKFIFIRYNPDKYKVNGKTCDTDQDVRLDTLLIEVKKQITRIHDNKNEDLLEIIYLYYDT
jgi:hypothetical protein